ncbi:carnitine O-palmitoyltransferase 2, mitochondrial isoform X2 [Hydra vulgaris]|uniref:Carnitine O-palmitoyltransferase 2, mitochondrial isoform X2 n=1 Tax=Hydra vulgaris TaxID=6087 RepID=A0ABM4DIE4_HYDVU
MLSTKTLRLFRFQGSEKLLVGTTPNIIYSRQKHSDESQYLQSSIIPTMHFQKSLPRLPIPKLEDTVRRYLEAQKPLLSSDAYKNTKQNADNFLGLDGKVLHSELIAKDNAMKHTSFISEPWFDMYLKYRDSIVLNHNPFVLAVDDPSTTDQLTRATKLVYSSLLFKNSLDASNLEPDVYHMNPKKSDTNLFRRLSSMAPSSLSWYVAYLFKAFPLDMSQYSRLFNTTRVPKPLKDELKTIKGGRQVLVIRNGHIFLFDAIDKNGNLVSKNTIHANLKAIVEKSNTLEENSLAVLTSEKRDTWASLRAYLEKNPKNSQLLHSLDSALFGLFLDDKECLNEQDASKIFLYGEGHSRWFDKSFHMALSKNAKMAINFEHSWGDGVSVVRFLNEATKASAADLFNPTENTDSSLTFYKLDFEIDDVIKNAISKAQETFNERTSKLKVTAGKVENFGKNFLKTKNLSPDAMMQLAFQIAYFRQNGKHAATYESCSTAAFKHGRTETVRPCTVATVACAEAFNSSHSASVSEMCHLLKESSDMHNKLTKEAAMGAGFDRHLFALNHLAQSTNRKSEFFDDYAYKNINHNILSTSTVASPYIQLGGFAPVVQNGLGIGYLIQDNWLGCNITSYPDSPNPTEFVELLKKSLMDIYSVLEGKNFK